MTSWAGRLCQSLQAFNYSDDYSDDDGDLQVALRESFDTPYIDEDVVMGVTIASTSPKLTLVDDDGECCLCWDKIEHGKTYFQSPCKHIYCSDCISNPMLNKCTRCNQEFNTAEPITAIKVKIET
jgi:hypothetical protein